MFSSEKTTFPCKTCFNNLWIRILILFRACCYHFFLIFPKYKNNLCNMFEAKIACPVVLMNYLLLVW